MMLACEVRGSLSQKSSATRSTLPARAADAEVRVLTVNAGSSSLKLRLLDGEDAILAEDELALQQGRIDQAELAAALDSPLGGAQAIGHRIVHGGDRFRSAVRIDPDVELALRGLSELAPLHQAKSLAALDAVGTLFPDLPAVACFDTAFHATMPAAAVIYALPAGWRDRWGLRRYGFHGLSHAWVARRVPELLGRARPGLRIVSCHLGAGASLCAIKDGRSLDTTMGFTPLEGLVMATRSGNVDPGMLLWLLERGELDATAMADGLEQQSGLLGLCGTGDMREVLRLAGVGEEQAELALEVYLHRLRAQIAAMSAALGGLDALAFTGGVGERSAEVRELAVEGLEFLGLAIDRGLNRAASGDAHVSSPRAPVATFVVAAREDLEISHQVRAVLSR
jgi:acetate kinase